MPDLHYSHTERLSPEQFIDILVRSSLGERRPIADRQIITAMLDNAALLCTAWDDGTLVGVARSVTDFAYCCYLSDLAVDVQYQRQGIGKGLIAETQKALGDGCKLILLAAPKAREYYPRLGFESHPSAWVIGARSPLQ